VFQRRSVRIAVVSKFSLIDTHFESDRGRTKVKTFVACAPGFGIREVFCGVSTSPLQRQRVG
jgi:hypothetical protein